MTGMRFSFQVHRSSVHTTNRKMFHQSKRLRRSCPHGFFHIHDCEDCCMAAEGTREDLDQAEPHSVLLCSPRRDDRKRKPSFSYPSLHTNAIHQSPVVDRFNQIRPNYLLMGRVSGYNYPPPEHYGWIFTGSCPLTKAEFYQMEIELGTVYLDFYYTDGTVTSVLCHKLEGNMVLFAKGRSLLPDIYTQILRDPLATTDTKYRRRRLFS